MDLELLLLPYYFLLFFGSSVFNIADSITKILYSILSDSVLLKVFSNKVPLRFIIDKVFLRMHFVIYYHDYFHSYHLVFYVIVRLK